jgi:hypothetical protein
MHLTIATPRTTVVQAMRHALARWAVPCGAALLYAIAALAQSEPPTATMPPVPSGGAPAKHRAPEPAASASAAASATPAAPSAAPAVPSAAPAVPSPAPPVTAPHAAAPAMPNATVPRLGPPPRPPPGYYAPPAYGYYPYSYPYPYGYAYPAPPPERQPVYPPDAAARESPFFDGIAGGVVLGQRISAPACFGAEAGVFVAARVRIAAKLLFNASEARDTNNDQTLADGWDHDLSPSAAFEWGGSIGYAALSTSAVVMSPGLMFMRTDRSAYGTFLGASLPVTWVHSNGLRIGLDAAIGESFGGTLLETCEATGEPGFPSPCPTGQVREIDRDASIGLYGAFTIGFGFNHPEPIGVKRQALSRAQ